MSALNRARSEKRLDFRLSSEHKAIIEEAAKIQGLTISGFASSVLVKIANEVISKEASRVLSSRDSQTFMAMLSSDSDPNEALKTAAARYKEQRGQ